MATITYTFDGNADSLGTAKKDSLTYLMRETESEWKLVSADDTLKVEWKWSKKDCETFDDWCAALKDNGFDIVK